MCKRMHTQKMNIQKHPVDDRSMTENCEWMQVSQYSQLTGDLQPTLNFLLILRTKYLAICRYCTHFGIVFTIVLSDSGFNDLWT